MIKKLSVSNFKCFENMEMELKPFTILCGINSSGKSSVIQALLLGLETANQGKNSGVIDLINSRYNINLYSFDEILYDDTDEEKIYITLSDEYLSNRIEYTSEENDNDLKYKIIGSIKSEVNDKVWYLGSDRTIAPYQERGNIEALELGRNNEYLGFILEKGRSNKIVANLNKNCKDMDNTLFTIQVNEWLNYILPENKVIAVAMDDNLISLRFGKNQKLHKTNVGYGISFVLPIIVGGLLAKEDDILIIENPELHLHPKAQSNLMFFLAKMVVAGVQIIIETHSDHIVNGIRRAIINPNCEFVADDVAVYFFNGNENYNYIRIDASAELSERPDDFMEQEENDLYYIRRMRMENDIKRFNGH